MKNLQRLFTAIVLFVVTNGISQSESSKIEKFKIQEVGITVNNLEELKSIDWNDLFDIFDMDEDNSKINFYIELKDFKASDKNNNDVYFSEMKYAVSGYKNDRKKLETFMRIITKRILKIYKN